MKRLLSSLWSWSPVVTLPVTIVFAYWLAETYSHFRAFRIEYDATPVDVRLHEVGVDQWRDLVRHARLAATPRSLRDIPPSNALNTVQLFVAESDLDKLRSDLPYSGYDYVKGQLMFADGLHEVKVRYRGDFLTHWGYDKKSIRVKTRTDELFSGMRQFNLIVPKFPSQLNNYLGYRLARIMGLISPRTELVNVTMNGRNLGMHQFTEQLEEGTLRSWDRMPGDLYSGDLIGKSQIAGTTSRVFELPQLWDKVAENNHYPPGSRAPLTALLELLNDTPSEETEEQLSKLFDMDVWGRFGAYELLTQTHHYDEYHNWRLFWDPWALKFQPVIWDPTPWAPEMRPPPREDIWLDLVISRLHIWLHRNGDYLAARHRALKDFYENGQLERFLEETDWAVAAAREAIALDPNHRPTDPAEIERGLTTFREFIDRVVHELRLGHLETPGKVLHTMPTGAADGTSQMSFQVEGRIPVDEVVLRFQRPVRQSLGARLRVHRGRQSPTVDLSGGVIAQGNTLRIPARMMSQLQPRLRKLESRPLREYTLREQPGYYELLLEDLPTDNPLMEVLFRRGDHDLRGQAVESLQPTELEWLFRATPALPARDPIVFSGEVFIEGIREIFDDVVIEPGTTVRLAPYASILFRGHVDARGTAERPIRFIPADFDRAAGTGGPWGTVALNSPHCSGSTLRFCEFLSGSGYRSSMEEYTAMLSVHNCRDVRVEDCLFRDNFDTLDFVIDDMIHVMYSEIVFDRVTLDNAKMDALDCDISRVVVRNSKFIRCGNDGVDLMTTWAVVHDCVFDHNGDKGISIGEGSSLIAIRNYFDGCGRGLEAKDGSIAHVVNCEIHGCDLAINAYRKNWRYDAGGLLTVEKSVFKDNARMPTADRTSRITIRDCQHDKPIVKDYVPEGKQTPQPNNVTIVDSNHQSPPRHKRPLPFPDELDYMEAMARGVWATIRIDMRGGARGE